MGCAAKTGVLRFRDRGVSINFDHVEGGDWGRLPLLRIRLAPIYD